MRKAGQRTDQFLGKRKGTKQDEIHHQDAYGVLSVHFFRQKLLPIVIQSA
jgi:hypothetical protein